MIWGATFVIVKISLETVDPFAFVFGRFTIALIVLAVFSWTDLRVYWKSHLATSTLLGIVLFVGFLLQVLGLQRTSSSSAGFITGLNVVLVAVLDVVINRRLPTILGLLGFVSAFSGLAILSIGESHIGSFGNILVFGCAVAFGLHVFLTDRYSKLLNVRVLATEQIGIVALLSLVGTIANGGSLSIPSDYACFGILYTGLLATALAYFLQTWSQRRAEATHSAVVLSAEPLFAAAFTVVLISEAVTTQLVVGGMLIITGMLLSSLGRQN